jgi:hypothetical protein
VQVRSLGLFQVTAEEITYFLIKKGGQQLSCDTRLFYCSVAFEGAAAPYNYAASSTAVGWYRPSVAASLFLRRSSKQDAEEA